MKNTSKRPDKCAIFCICVLAFTLILIAAKVACNVLTLDMFTGYYSAAGTFISLYLPVICVVALALVCFIPKFGIEQAQTHNAKGVKMAAVVAAAGFAFYAFKCIELYMLYQALSRIQIVALIASILSAVFFIMTAFAKQLESAIYLICGIAVILFAVCAVSSSYFDLLTPMNSPIKLMNELGALSLMLLMLSEMRATFDEATKRRKLQLFSVSASVLMLGVSAIPSVICYLLGYLPYGYALIFTDIVFVCAFVFATVRFISLCFSTDTEATEIGRAHV